MFTLKVRSDTPSPILTRLLNWLFKEFISQVLESKIPFNLLDLDLKSQTITLFINRLYEV